MIQCEQLYYVSDLQKLEGHDGVIFRAPDSRHFFAKAVGRCPNVAGRIIVDLYHLQSGDIAKANCIVDDTPSWIFHDAGVKRQKPKAKKLGAKPSDDHLYCDEVYEDDF
jgi:hypothetical protein